MFEKFEEIFWMVGKRYNLTNWWDIFDSEVFEEVEEEIFARYGENPKGYNEWVKEMAEDL